MTPGCEAYLVVDADAGAGPLEPGLLARAIREHPVACLLLSSRSGDAAMLQHLVKAAQTAGAAVVVEASVPLALATGADGVHLPYLGSPEEAERLYREARAALGAERIVGAATGLARHDAMVLAELAADYVAFDRGAGEDFAALCGHVAWWAEMFEVPCVAWGAASAEEAAALAEAGADFVAVGPLGGVAAALAVLEALPAEGAAAS